MMNGASNNLLVRHYDWIAAGVGGALLVIAVVLVGVSFGSSPEGGRAAYDAKIATMKPGGEGVAPNDMKPYLLAVRTVKVPPALGAVDAKHGSFLASERRVFCTQNDESSKKPGCGRPIPGDATVCPFCGMKQPALAKVFIDSDNDGIPNDYEVAHGLNPNDPADAAKDADGDGFTNLEEFKAGTDPKDPASHPDYLDSLAIDGQLKTTVLPVFFQTANPIPGGHRLTFRDPDAAIPGLRVRGKNYNVLLGEPIGDTGFVATNYTHKTEQRVIKGSRGGMTKTVDVSTATLFRKADGKTLVLVIGQRNVPVDVQARLTYHRGAGKTFTVTVGSKFTLSGRDYRVFGIRQTDKTSEIVIEAIPSGEQRIIRGLD